MNDIFNWKQYASYRVFDEFLQQFLLGRKSYITTHKQDLDFSTAFEDIKVRFVDEYDDSESNFGVKLNKQFDGASLNTKIVFANVYYLWAMPMENLLPDTKRRFVTDWFPEQGTVVSGSQYFFGEPDTIANPGQYYLRHKYWEIVAILRVLNIIRAEIPLNTCEAIKESIVQICHKAIYLGVPESDTFYTKDICAAHAALLHMAAPDDYQSIIADSHKDLICSVFNHELEPEEKELPREKKTEPSPKQAL